MKAGLKKEWGGLYTRNTEAARRAVFKYIGEEGDAILSKLPPSPSYKLVRAFAQIGDPLLEDDVVTGNLKGMPTAEEINKKLQAMLNDKNHPLNDVSMRGHKEAVEEYDKLNKMYVQMTKIRR